MAFQTVVAAKIVQAALTTSTAASIYVCPLATQTYLKDIDIANTTTSAVTVFVFLVPSSTQTSGAFTTGTAAASNALLYNVAIPASTTLQWTGTQIMLPGDSIQAYASATGVTLTASGATAT